MAGQQRVLRGEQVSVPCRQALARFQNHSQEPNHRGPGVMGAWGGAAAAHRGHVTLTSITWSSVTGSTSTCRPWLQ